MRSGLLPGCALRRARWSGASHPGPVDTRTRVWFAQPEISITDFSSWESLEDETELRFSRGWTGMSELSVTDFRNRARAWLEQHAPRTGGGEAGEPGRADIAAQQAFQAKLYDARIAGINWPKEYGVQGLTKAAQ